MHEWRGFIYPLQWERMRDDLPPPKKRPFRRRDRKGGRPRRDDKSVFEAILWSAYTGVSLRNLPPRYGSPRTIYRRLAEWERTGRLHELWRFYMKWSAGPYQEDWRRHLLITTRPIPRLWRYDLLSHMTVHLPPPFETPPPP